MTVARGAIKRFALASCVALLMLGTGATALTAAFTYLAERETAFRRAEAERSSISTRLSRSQQDEPEIRRALERFDALRNQGVVGPERRLEWAERISLIRNTHKIPAIEFELAPQRKLPTSFSDISLRASTMTLRARLLHEGDLLRILEDLRQQGSAEVLPRRCVLERGTDSETTLPLALSAVCELDWITVSIDSPAAP